MRLAAIIPLVLGLAALPAVPCAHAQDGGRRPDPCRTDRVLRGVWLSAGQQTIEFRYEPRSFYIGAMVSAVSWLALGAFAITCIIRPRKPHSLQIE